jgi:hypothetical protein
MSGVVAAMIAFACSVTFLLTVDLLHPIARSYGVGPTHAAFIRARRAGRSAHRQATASGSL